MGNLTSSTTGAVTWSVTRQGMTIPSINGGARATSQSSSMGVVSLLADEFSLEFFFSSPFNPISQSLLIAGFGDWLPGTPFPVCDAANEVSEGGWRLYSTIGTTIRFSGVVSINGVPSCVNLAIPIDANTMRHMVVRARPGSVSMVSHGAIDENFVSGTSFNPSLWGRVATYLTIASPHATSAWTGTVFLLAMYNRYLSDAEIAMNRVLGPPNSLPFCNATSFSVYEDNRTIIFPTSVCSDFDRDPTQAQLRSLPSHGTLWHNNVTAVEGDIPLFFLPGSLEYQTAQDNTASATLRYVCTDSFGFGREATVTITIMPVNDAPLATSATATAFANFVANPITLTGTDVENNPIISARILSLPSIPGTQLRRVNVDNSVGPVIVLNEIVPALPNGLVQIYYSAAPASLSETRLDVVASDSFTFYVSDYELESAAPATISVTIRNNLQATTATVTTDEDKNVTFTLVGSDAAGEGVMFEVDSLPTLGTLHHHPSGALVTGSIPIEVGASVTYAPPPNAHGMSTPNDYVLEIFRFNLRGMSSGLRSQPRNISIRVLPVNDVPVSGCQGACSLSGVASTSTEAFVPFAATLSDIDSSFPLDQYFHVTIQPTEPYSVSIADSAVLAQPNVFHLSGDGRLDSLLQFIAPFSVAQQVLAGPMQLYASTPTTDGAPGSVFVTVADNYFFRPGASQPSRFSSSQATTTVFDFTIAPSPDASAQGSTSKLTAYAILIGFIGGPILCCFLIVYGCFYRRAKNAQRKAAHFASAEFAKAGHLSKEETQELEDAIATGDMGALQRQASQMFFERARAETEKAGIDTAPLLEHVRTGNVEVLRQDAITVAEGLRGRK